MLLEEYKKVVIGVNVTQTYPKIVLALGGGGARGFAHIGVLQVLKEAKIEIAGVVGTSMGALIGSTFAAGTDLYYLEKLIEYLSWENLIDFSLPKLGLINGDKIKTVIDLLTKGKNFEELVLPFWAVATDLHTGEEIVFRKGQLAPAVRASISIPGVFNPVDHENRILVDGGVVAGIPVLVAKRMNLDLVVAVNVGFDHTKHEVNNVFDILIKVIDIMGNRLDLNQLDKADLVIAPQLGATGILNFNLAKECIAIGRAAAEEALPSLQQLINHFQQQNEQAI